MVPLVETSLKAVIDAQVFGARNDWEKHEIGGSIRYIKPIATDVSLIDLRKSTNPLKLAWESVVAVVVTIFTNHTADQFATKIPLEGRLDNISTDTWAAIGGIIHNAFVEAFKKGIEGSVK